MSESLDSRSMPSRKAVVAKVLLWVVGISVLGAATGYVAYQVSPWPGALLIRIPFDRQAIRLNRALEETHPERGHGTAQ